MATDYLTVKQAADILQVTEDTVRAYINNPVHPLPASYLGKKAGYRILREDLDQWMRENKSRPKEGGE